MDDGSLHKYNCVLNVQGFSYANQELLIKTLKTKFNLNCSLHKDKNSYKLCILSSSKSSFFNIIKPYILESFFYKMP